MTASMTARRRDPWETTRQRMLGALVEAGSEPVGAEDLSRRLGVSTRSVRSYVSRLNTEHGREVVSSSRDGYAIDLAALAAADDQRPAASRRVLSPGERLASLLRSLLTADVGADVYELAEELRVSDSTLEADLTKCRALLSIHHLTLERRGPSVRICGTESAKRRLVRQIMTDAARSRTQFVSVRELAIESAEPSLLTFREGLTRILSELGLLATETNQHAILAHVAVMVGRLRQGHGLETPDAAAHDDALRREAALRIAALVESAFELLLPAGEVDYLVGLLDENTTPKDLSLLVTARVTADDDVDYVALVRQIVGQVGENYLIDLDNDRFIGFLSVHSRNLVRRAQRGQAAHIPIGQSIKDTHPLIYEVGIFIARRLELALGIEIRADEIGLISFHVGAHFESVYAREQRVRIALISPTYLDLQDSARALLQSAIAGVGEIELVAVDEAELTTDLPGPDLLVSTVPLMGLPQTLDRPVVQLSALPGAEDLERVRGVVLEIAQTKRRARVGSTLVNLIEPQFFLDLTASTAASATSATSREDVLAQMSEALMSAGVVDADFHRGVLEREAMASTSLGSGVAIPHSMIMGAHASSIAIHVPSEPIDWGGDPVSLVAMMAFSKDSREEFGELFESVIRVLSKPRNVELLAAHGGSYEEFISTLLDII
ncbi:BglG family transcription antiterminator [Brachybacterium tyrofermentans]|uniref:BglG family transcription antiterminator n=1 Tax=Brachybacterium tyrofermentans TaxID=47848 RepID=UPI003F8E6AF5